MGVGLKKGHNFDFDNVTNEMFYLLNVSTG